MCQSLGYFSLVPLFTYSISPILNFYIGGVREFGSNFNKSWKKLSPSRAEARSDRVMTQMTSVKMAGKGEVLHIKELVQKVAVSLTVPLHAYSAHGAV